MRTVDDYINLAKSRLGVSADRALRGPLGVSDATINTWRTKRNWPGDEVMLRLASLAGVPEDEALIELNAWRAVGAAREAYQRIVAKILGTAAAFLIFMHMGVWEARAQVVANDVYYGKSRRPFWRKGLARIALVASRLLSKGFSSWEPQPCSIIPP